MGRRAHQPDPGQRKRVETLAAYGIPGGRRDHRGVGVCAERVETLAAYGIPEADTSNVVGIDPKTLRKHYRDELDFGETKANAQVAGFLFTAARNGNVTAQIFWLKTRARWKEGPTELRHSGALGSYDLKKLTDAELERLIAILDNASGPT
jgi:hypothetical protein